MTDKYGRGRNPKSLANLDLTEGRPPIYGSRKRKRELTVTDEGWDQAKTIAKQLNCNSISDLLEKIGRGEIECSVKPQREP